MLFNPCGIKTFDYEFCTRFRNTANQNHVYNTYHVLMVFFGVRVTNSGLCLNFVLLLYCTLINT
jgi:hypothetical protein